LSKNKLNLGGKKIYMQKIERASTGNDRQSSNQNILIAGSNSKAFDVLDYCTTATQKQYVCSICNPSTEKGCSAAKLCAECAAKSETMTAAIFGTFAKDRKPVRLHQCSGCRRSVTPAKFSRDWGICKICVAGIQEKSKAARSNFIARTVNNFHKMLKGVAAL
jgi:hypothetical protein